VIYYDPTEARQGTLLSDSIINAGHSLPGLEKYTGADILVSPLRKPVLRTITDSKPSQLSLKKHTAHGLLVQRKTGMDAINSIPKLPEILARMTPWCDLVPPWLTLDGHYSERKGLVVVGRRVTRWRYLSFIGALDGWQASGGCVTILPDADALSAWIARWSDKIKVIPTRSTEKLVLTQPKIATDNYPWVATLATFPGIGATMATEIAHYTGSLKDSLVMLSDPTLLKLKKKGRYPKGIGPITIRNARRWLGLGEQDNGDLETFATDWVREK